MSANLFQRKAVVIVDGLRVEGLRVTFRVKKTGGGKPNTCELAISNLSEASRGRMKSKGSSVIVLAGYEETHGQIFAGVSRSITHRLDGPTWVTSVHAGDGETSYQFDRVSESFGPGTPVSRVVQFVIRAMLVDPGNSIEQARNVPGKFLQGVTLHGKAAAELQRILSPRGFEWSIQDGRLQILKPGERLKGQAVMLTPDTGLVGSPEICTSEKQGKGTTMKAKSLLNPVYRIGGTVEVKSRSHHGQFKVLDLEHSGDTEGGDWFTDLEMKPV